MNEATNVHPIFMDCVAKDAGRYAIDHPWVAGGYRYATDGRIIVRQRTDEPDSPATDGKKYPPTTDLPWDRSKYASEPVALPDIPDEAIEEKCDGCSGDGFRKCDMGHEHECGACDGAGFIERVYWFDIGGVMLQAHLVRLLNRHGAGVFPRAHNKPIYFTVGDIDGIVMPGSRDGINKGDILTAEKYRDALVAAKAEVFP